MTSVASSDLQMLPTKIACSCSLHRNSILWLPDDRVYCNLD